MKFILSDYIGNKKTFETTKAIKSAFLLMVSGDQILYVLYEDGTEDVFDALDGDGFRSMCYYDGGNFVDLNKAVDGMLDLSEEQE